MISPGDFHHHHAAGARLIFALKLSNGVLDIAGIDGIQDFLDLIQRDRPFINEQKGLNHALDMLNLSVCFVH